MVCVGLTPVRVPAVDGLGHIPWSIDPKRPVWLFLVYCKLIAHRQECSWP